MCAFGASAQNTMIREHQSARRLVTNSILRERIEHLCDSICEGRGSGQRGGGLAALWLQREFENIGLMKMSGGFFSAVLFGIIFSLGWTPCVGAFLGSALALASQQGHAVEGMLMLLAYSLGLGVPFLLSAVLIDKLKSAFNWIKAHYGVINLVCGAMLVFVGVLMMTGTMGVLVAWLS